MHGRSKLSNAEASPFSLTRFLAHFLQRGGSQTDGASPSREEVWLARYKRVIASIVPPAFVGPDGLVQGPAESVAAFRHQEYIVIIPPPPGWRTPHRGWLFSESGPPASGASYRGGLFYKLLRRRLVRAERAMPPDEYHALLDYIQREIIALPATDMIDLSNQKRPGSLAHEAFHDIRGFLLDHHPHVFDAIHDKILPRARELFEQWYADPSTAQWRTNRDYQLQHIFPEKSSDAPYSDEVIQEAMSYSKQITGRKLMSQGFWEDVYPETLMDSGRVEAIPVLLAAAVEKCQHAQKILREIFDQAGLNGDFMTQMPDFT